MKTLQEIQEFNRKAVIMACNPEAKKYSTSKRTIGRIVKGEYYAVA